MIKLEGAHLRERIALIIGAGVSQGIGFLTAEAMAAAEATVVWRSCQLAPSVCWRPV